MEQSLFFFAERPVENRSPSCKPPMEFKVQAMALRECVPVSIDGACDTPEKAVSYWRTNIENQGWHDPEREMFVVLFLNTQLIIKGHHVVSLGTLDSVVIHPREVFRCAIAIAARSIMIMHNHPSGNPQPSEADIKITQELIRAGKILKIEVMDHVIVGKPDFASLRSLGYFDT